MIRILIYDIAAAYGGAKKVLDEFYEEYRVQKDYECYFVTSVLDYPANQRMHVIKLPWTKKSWIHRLYCDYFYMPKLIKRLGVKEVLSLQNMGIPHCPVKQTVYVHNAIPFTEYQFSLFQEPFLWLYQNVIGRLIYSSLKQADRVIVQTQWMKQEVIERCCINEDKIEVKEVKVKQRSCVPRQRMEQILFFYPATPFKFKNCEIIIKACKLLKEKGIENYEVVMTFTGTENRLAKTMGNKIKNYDLPIKLIGRLSTEQMEIFYKKAILLFPSYLETVGLPLLEAKAFKTPIVSADCRYAHDALKEYGNVCYFNHEDANALKAIMLGFIDQN